MRETDPGFNRRADPDDLVVVFSEGWGGLTSGAGPLRPF